VWPSVASSSVKKPPPRNSSPQQSPKQQSSKSTGKTPKQSRNIEDIPKSLPIETKSQKQNSSSQNSSPKQSGPSYADIARNQGQNPSE